MNDWTIGSFLFALGWVILGAAALGTLLQRTFFKNEPPKNPVDIFVQWNARKLRSSALALLGLAVALAVYPLLSLFGWSGKPLIYGVALVVWVLVMIVLIRLRARREV